MAVIDGVIHDTTIRRGRGSVRRSRGQLTRLETLGFGSNPVEQKRQQGFRRGATLKEKLVEGEFVHARVACSVPFVEPRLLPSPSLLPR